MRHKALHDGPEYKSPTRDYVKEDSIRFSSGQKKTKKGMSATFGKMESRDVDDFSDDGVGVRDFDPYEQTGGSYKKTVKKSMMNTGQSDFSYLSNRIDFLETKKSKHLEAALSRQTFA